MKEQEEKCACVNAVNECTLSDNCRIVHRGIAKQSNLSEIDALTAKVQELSGQVDRLKTSMRIVHDSAEEVEGADGYMAFECSQYSIEQLSEVLEDISATSSANWRKEVQAEARKEALREAARICDNNACDYTREGAEVCAAEIRALMK